MMLACYRSSEASDPETFITAVSAILSNYHQDIAAAVANPTTGLPSRSKWLPSVAEVRDECERLMAPRYAEAAREARRAHTEAVLGDHPLKRIAKARFDELSAKLEAVEEPNGKPKPFTLKLTEGVDPFAGKPLRVSTELQSLLAPKDEDE